MANDYFSSPTDIEAATRARASTINDLDAAVDAAFDKVPSETHLKRGTTSYAGASTGSSNAYVVTLPYTPSGYVDGLKIIFKANHANTSAATVNVNSLGVKSLKRQNGEALIAGDLEANKIYSFLYNTTSGFFELESLAAGVIADIETVSGIAGNVTTVAGVSVEITNLAAQTAEIAALAAQTANIGALAGHTAQLVALGDKSAQIVSLGAMTAQLASLGDKTAQIVSLGAQSAEIAKLGAQTADLAALGAQTAQLASLGAMTAQLASLGAQTANIASVAAHTADLTTVVLNMTAITAAPAYAAAAQSAANQATAALAAASIPSALVANTVLQVNSAGLAYKLSAPSSLAIDMGAGVANGLATLDSSGQLTLAQRPPANNDFVLITSTSLAASSALDISLDPTTYASYEVVLEGVTIASAGHLVGVPIAGGAHSTASALAGYWIMTTAQATAGSTWPEGHLPICDTMGTANPANIHIDITVSTGGLVVRSDAGYSNNAGNVTYLEGKLMTRVANQTALRIQVGTAAPTSTVAMARYVVWGKKK